jgi:hypothetical protein
MGEGDIMRMLIVTLLAALASNASAQQDTQSEALARASSRGALLYAYDQAAWHGTDDMLTKLKDPSNEVGGYIVDGPVTAPRLIFFDKAGHGAVYIATFSGNRLVEGHVLSGDEDRTLSPLDQRMILAVGAARTAISKDGNVRPCASRPFNTVVLPPESSDGPVPVYFLTPQVVTNTVPFGGHFEIDVDAQGNAGNVRQFSKSCFDMPTSASLPAGAKPESLVVTHLLDPVPTEIHVFNSLVLRMPVMVSTVSNKMIWPVEGAKIGKPIPLPAKP